MQQRRSAGRAGVDSFRGLNEGKEGHNIIGPGCQSIPFDGLLSCIIFWVFLVAVFGGVFLGSVRERGAGRVVIGVPGRSVLRCVYVVVLRVVGCRCVWPAARLCEKALKAVGKILR